MTTETAPPVSVHIASVDMGVDLGKRAKTSDRHTTFITFIVGPGLPPVQILAHSPDRIEALITISGAATNVGYVCGSSGDASNGVVSSGQFTTGMILQGGQTVRLKGTDEAWFICDSAVAANYKIGVAQVYGPV